MIKLLPLAVLFVSLAGPARAEEKDLQALVKSLKPSVVNIYANTAFGLAGDLPGSWSGTGFIVDEKRGWIVTNRHIVTRSPAQYKVTFYDGETTGKVRLLHYDPWADLAVLQFDTSTIEMALTPIALGDSEAIKEQQKVFLIGNNEGNNYSILYGEVTNVVENPGIADDPAGDSHRHSSSFQVVYGTRGGSSGSPILDMDGKVLGVQCSASDTTGDALRISYVADALKCLREGKASCRGDAGAVLDLMHLSDAIDHLRLSKDIVAKEIAPAAPDIKDVLYVKKTIPSSTADGKLEPGDVIIRAGDKVVGDDLHAFDREVDKHIGASISITVARGGRLLTFVLPVHDAERDRITHFATFGGGVFHDATPEFRRRFAVSGSGVIMSQAETGSSFDIGSHLDKYPQWRLVQVQAVNGVVTPDLQAFVGQIRNLKDGDPIYITARDFVTFDASPKIFTMDLNLKYQPLKKYRFSTRKLGWEDD